MKLRQWACIAGMLLCGIARAQTYLQPTILGGALVSPSGFGSDWQPAAGTGTGVFIQPQALIGLLQCVANCSNGLSQQWSPITSLSGGGGTGSGTVSPNSTSTASQNACYSTNGGSTTVAPCTTAQNQANSTDTTKNASIIWNYASGGDTGLVTPSSSNPVQDEVSGGLIYRSYAGGAFTPIIDTIAAGANVTVTVTGHTASIAATAPAASAGAYSVYGNPTSATAAPTYTANPVTTTESTYAASGIPYEGWAAGGVTTCQGGTTSGCDTFLSRPSAGLLSADTTTAGNGLGAYLEALHTPTSSAEACAAGTIRWDASFIYICTATNTYRRVALSSF